MTGQIGISDQLIYEFGDSIFNAQLLELAVVDLFVVLKLALNPEMTDVEIWNELESATKDTFGRVLSKLQNTNVNSDLYTKLVGLKDKRNYLCHNFFIVNSARLVREQDELIAELQELGNQFNRARQTVSDETIPYLSRFGISAENISQRGRNIMISLYGT